MLCEKYREGDKIKTRILANLSHLSEEKIMILENAIKLSRGHTMILEEDLEIEKTVDIGYVFLILHLFNTLKISKMFEQLLTKEHVGIVKLMLIKFLMVVTSTILPGKTV
jgi:hypothetical protein